MLHMTRANNNKADMVLMTLSDSATGTAQWQSNEALKREFTEKGAITGPITSGPSSEGNSVNGAIIAPLKLAPIVKLKRLVLCSRGALAKPYMARFLQPLRENLGAEQARCTTTGGQMLWTWRLMYKPTLPI
ncbi:hypothetical protein [Psychrosphaera algicola]|uniref:Uncharacterized protein n=1 Tax=Psychrosphaera algicola TaxID=3023714 RepID=A0ABT5FAJ3_9GAMM|nr:hypothetical protein [Psychrosphaera sp. G1-22]MDC2888558.1 hypothetical protein [Psychrosphaera sp. G1-22]